MPPPTAPTCGMPSGSPASLETMDVHTLFSKMTDKQRSAWYLKQLGPLDKRLRASAQCNSIPPQLLAVVLLNELADINWTDVWQQRLGMNGSLGIGQIQVSTAVSDGLLDFPGDQRMIHQRALQAYRFQSMLGHPPTLTVADYEKMIRLDLIRTRLTTPQFAIEAAAREIRSLLDRMTKNLGNPWQTRFSFNLTSLSQLSKPEDVYNHIAGLNQREKELNLSEMVVAAYNSPDIIIAKQTSSVTMSDPKVIYRNGMIHGSNSRFIAGQLYDENLFH